MKRKYLVLSLAAFLLLGACGKTNDGDNTDKELNDPLLEDGGENDIGI